MGLGGAWMLQEEEGRGGKVRKGKRKRKRRRSVGANVQVTRARESIRHSAKR